jgi:hypothetical protein
MCFPMNRPRVGVRKGAHELTSRLILMVARLHEARLKANYVKATLEWAVMSSTQTRLKTSLVFTAESELHWAAAIHDQESVVRVSSH